MGVLTGAAPAAVGELAAAGGRDLREGREGFGGGVRRWVDDGEGGEREGESGRWAAGLG